MLWIHARALHEPRDIGRIERRSDILLHKSCRGILVTGLFHALQTSGKAVEVVAMSVGQQIVGSTGMEVVGMCVAEATYHAVGKEVLHLCVGRLLHLGQLGEQVDACLTVEAVDELGEIGIHADAVARRLVPNTRLAVVTVVSQTAQRPLTQR